MLNIEKMKPDDWEAVSKIYAEGLESNMATFESTVPNWEFWNEHHLEEGRFVAKEDNEIIGFIALAPTSYRKIYSGVAEVSVYIDGQNRGRGIAAKLINKVIEFADNNDIWTLQASILEENEASIQLNEKCGFRTIGYRENIAKDKYGNWRNIVFMERRSRKIGFAGCDMSNCKMKDMFSLE